MRKLFALILLAISLLSCSKDNVTNTPVGISVAISPVRMIVDLADTTRFTALIYGTSDRRAIWKVEDIQGGNSTFGTIDSTGKYTAPIAEPNLDSVRITATSRADITKIGAARVILINPSFVYVDTSGSDVTGIGSLHNPFRTIKKAVTEVIENQTIKIGPGVYDQAHGEVFPYTIGLGVTIEGAGMDSTHIIGPANGHTNADAIIKIDGFNAGLEKCRISTVNGNGVAVWARPGLRIIANNHIGPNYIGIYADGVGVSSIGHNRIISDSIGIVTADSARPFINDCMIDSASIYGILIKNFSRPNLGDTLSNGRDTILVYGAPPSNYLIRNESADTIWAIGNIWPFASFSAVDNYIYDNDENPSSGPVILQWPPLK